MFNEKKLSHLSDDVLFFLFFLTASFSLIDSDRIAPKRQRDFD